MKNYIVSFSKKALLLDALNSQTWRLYHWTGADV